eukprot:5869024-Prymnesium_polylepis.2
MRHQSAIISNQLVRPSTSARACGAISNQSSIISNQLVRRLQQQLSARSVPLETSEVEGGGVRVSLACVNVSARAQQLSQLFRVAGPCRLRMCSHRVHTTFTP